MTISKASIRSAGQGSRLLPLTADMPKCMIDFNGRTLIEWQIEALKANGIRDIAVVTGFRTAVVDAQLATIGGAAFEVIFNPIFKGAATLGTGWITRHGLDREAIRREGA